MVVDYLIKPISPAEIISRVESIMRDCQNRGIEVVRAENMIRELVVEW
jgi:DNA-binding response OmpR family regulator